LLRIALTRRGCCYVGISQAACRSILSKADIIVNRSASLTFMAMAALFAANAPAVSQTQPPDYHISKVVPLGPPDRWDYVAFDPDSRRVYVAHGDRLTVVDGGSGAIIGTVQGMPGGTHGVAISHATGKGYTDDGKAGTVAVFDLTTLKVVKQIKAESDADGIVFDPPSGHIFVVDGDSGKLTVIDPKTEAVVATIDGGGGLEFGGTGNNGKFYVDGAEKNEIVRVDTATNKADAHWAMPTCVTPHGLAIDQVHRRLFASCSNKVMVVMNADNGAVIATLPIGEGSDFAVFDPERSVAYSSNRDGTLSAIAEKTPENFVALTPIPSQIGARTMAIDPKSGRIYLVTAEMTVNESAATADFRHRYSIKPGSVRLLFLDRTP
jgi:YVTN family beta-propeller protein